MRGEIDAVMIGRGSAEADDPSLTVHSMPGRNPMRIILDSKCRLSPTLQVFTDEYRGLTMYCHGEDQEHSVQVQQLREQGVQTIACMLGQNGQIDLPMLFATLSKEYGIASILIEGGGILMQEIIERQLMDEMHVFIAPMLIGQGKKAIGAYSAVNLEQAFKLRTKAIMKSGNDIHIIAVTSA
jgi:riboflavin-specific deaminase-like protein